MAQSVCPLVLAEDRARLEAIVADRNRAQKHVARARIILASAERLPVAAVAKQAAVGRPAVWRSRSDKSIDTAGTRPRPAIAPPPIHHPTGPDTVRLEVIRGPDPLRTERKETPVCLAIARPVQWVAAPGGSAQVSVTIRRTVWSPRGALPGLRVASRSRPSTPASANGLLEVATLGDLESQSLEDRDSSIRVSSCPSIGIDPEG